jgi:serine/threonine protein kinase
MQKLANGTELGTYRIVRQIGHGGMGEVYEAYEQRLQRRVALKVIAPRKADEYGAEDLVRRFLQEAQALAQVNHPNIVIIYSIGKVGNAEFIVMEFVAGALLKDMFSLFALSADEAAPIFLGTLEGLRALHEKRILHRDLKPHNLILKPNGQIKILDFGIAKRVGDQNSENTTAGVVVGTLAYLPPEVLYGNPATERSDLWSLGAIFYECLVGQPLVSAHSMKIKGIRAATDSDVIFPQEALAWVPEEMRRIVGRLANRNPADRYASALEAIEDIKRFQAQRPALPTSYSKALAKTVDNINDIKFRVKEEKLASPKSKRTFWLAMMGEPLNAQGKLASAEDTYVPQQAEISEGGFSEEINDSVSARNRAQSRSETRRRSNRTVVYVSAVVMVLMVLITAIQLSRRATSTGGSESPTQLVRLIAPTDRQVIWLEPGMDLTFGWSQVLNNGDYVLQVAWDKDFSSMVINEPVMAKSYRVSAVPSEGEYYWRLSPLRNPSLPAIGPLRFSILGLDPVELNRPLSGQKFKARPGASTSVDMAWNCKASVQQYRVQLSDDSEFKNLLDEKVIAKCAWHQLHLLPGNYYWRVSVEKPQSPKLLWSHASSFAIQQLRAPGMESKPELLSPKMAVLLKFMQTSSSREIASPQRRIENPPELVWSKVRNAHGYHLQIASTSDFSHLVLSTEVANIKYVWQDVIPGSFYWRVRAQEANTYSAYSDVGTLKVRLPAPDLSSDFSISHKDVLQWKAVPMAQKYIVQSSAVRSMASVSEKQTVQPQMRIDNKALYVRVAAVNSAGERVSEYSAPVTLATESEALPAVALKTPREGAKVQVDESGKTSVKFSWAPVKGAVNYEIQVSSNERFTKIVEEKTQPGHLHMLKRVQLKKGQVFWRVRAVSQSGPESWSAIGHFNVR